MKRILAAMTINKVSRLIRITGALTDKNAFSPFVFLFNLLGSFRIKWNELSEIDIRRNGVDYTGMNIYQQLEVYFNCRYVIVPEFLYFA